MYVRKRFFRAVILVLLIRLIIQAFADENDTVKFLENIRQVIKKSTEGNVKKRESSKAHKPKIKKQIIHKLTLPFKQFKRGHAIIKEEYNKLLPENLQQFTGGDSRKQLPTAKKLPPLELTKSIRRLFRENPSLMPFRFPTIKKSEDTLTKPQDKGNNISSNDSQRKDGEKLPFGSDGGYIYDLREWLSEIVLKSAQFWMLVVNIFNEIIEADLYSDFIHDYCSPETDLVVGSRDYRYNPPRLEEIFNFERLNRSMEWNFLYLNRLRAHKGATFFLKRRDLCQELVIMDRFFGSASNLIEDIGRCVYKNEKCEDLNKNLDIFTKLANRYFKLINKSVPSLIEAALLPLRKGSTGKSTGKQERGGRNIIVELIYNFLWEKEYLSTFFVGAALENNVDTISSAYHVCEKVRKSVWNYISKLTSSLSNLFFCQGVCSDYTGGLDTAISKILTQYNENKGRMRYSVDEMIIEGRQKFVSIFDNWVRQFYSLKDVEKFCVIGMLSHIKLLTNDISKNGYREINKRADEIIHLLGMNGVANLLIISFLNPLTFEKVVRECLERLPVADASASLDGDVNRANVYIDYVKYLDIIVVINEVRFAIKSCLKEVKEPLEDAVGRCGAGFLSFFKNVVEKNDIFQSMEEYLGDDSYKGVKSVLQKVYPGGVPVISLSKIDMFFKQLRAGVANKKYSDIIDGDKGCCDKCMTNSECLNHSSTCSVFLGEPQWNLEGIPIDKLKSVCPIEGVKQIDFFSPESRCVLAFTGFVWPPLDMECNKKGGCPSTCPIEIADKLRNVNYLLDPSKTTFGGKNFCQVIDEFYSCCQYCTNCDRTTKWCTERFTPINLRMKYLKMLKDKIGEQCFDIIMERIKSFETITPFSEKAVEKILKQIGLECMK